MPKKNDQQTKTAKKGLGEQASDIEFDAMPGSDGAGEVDQDYTPADYNFGFGKKKESEDDDSDDEDDSDEDEDSDDEESDKEDADEDESDKEDSDDEESDDEADKKEDESEDDSDENTDKTEDKDDGKPAKKEDKSGSKKSIMIPKARFDEVNGKLKQLQKDLDRERARTQPKKDDEDAGEEYNFLAKEKEYMELVMDGEMDKAMTIRAEIDEAKEAKFEKKFSKASSEDASRTVTQRMIDAAATELEERFPMLNPDNTEVYDEDLTKEVIAIQTGYIQSGRYKTIEAMHQAVETVMKARGMIDMSDGKSSKKDKVADERKRKSLADKIDAAKKQPNKLAGDSNSSSKKDEEVDIDTLSDEEFASMPSSAIARMRGDIL